MADDIILYDNVKFSDLLREIHTTSREKRTKIDDLITTMASFITNTSQASVIAPIISDYLDSGIKNDEQLVKLGQLVQRMKNKSTSDNIFSDEERDRLMKDIEDLNFESAEDVHSKPPDQQNELNRFLNSGG